METILIVDDTRRVRECLRHVLLDEGYTVLTAPDGQEAVETAAQWTDCIDLLITDVAIPRMSCTLMVENLQAQRPRLKVLYMSGHSRDVAAEFERETRYTKGGKTAITIRSRVSADGKTLTVAVKGADFQGKPVDGTNVYEKQ